MVKVINTWGGFASLTLLRPVFYVGGRKGHCRNLGERRVTPSDPGCRANLRFYVLYEGSGSHPLHEKVKGLYWAKEWGNARL